MKQYTGIILNKNREIVSILCDGLSLFSNKESVHLENFIHEKSELGISRFFDYLSDLGLVLDWAVELLDGTQDWKVYFSGVLWMDYYLLCISNEKGYCEFISLKSQYSSANMAENTNKENDHIEEFNEISRLNNELIDIQRELTRKNLNLELLNGRLEELATTDPLTGIFNRRAVFDRVRLEFNRAWREKRPCGFAILDIDDFKKINDQFGHLMGDDALVITSNCLKQSTRQYDVAGRIGGDEFLLFFSVNSKGQLKKILDRLLFQINNQTMNISGELTIRIKISIGAVFIDPGKDINELGINILIKKADDALYNAKDRGGNTVMIQDL